MSGWISIGDPDPQALTPHEKRVKELMDKGYHYHVIAAILRVSHDTAKDMIYEIRKKEGIMRKPTITDEEKQTMKRMFAEGKTIQEIADATGRGRSSVDRIVNDRKPAEVNKEFDAAVDQMIATMHGEPEKLEDVENGIPNTPLVTENADKNSAIAEEKSTIVEEWRLPYNVQVAVDRYISDIDEEIAMRAERIAELTKELEEWTAKRADLAAFKKAYSDKVAAAARAAS